MVLQDAAVATTHQQLSCVGLSHAMRLGRQSNLGCCAADWPCRICRHTKSQPQPDMEDVQKASKATGGVAAVVFP
eukprot:3635927-Amphidinium_carterae.1